MLNFTVVFFEVTNKFDYFCINILQAFLCWKAYFFFKVENKTFCIL